jgi:hypothetical protein
MRRITLSALALIGSIGIADVARAGCCDDFWSCLGAVASAGLSCQIQGIIDAVNAMKQLVETVTNDLRTRTGDVISQAQKAVTDASNDLKLLREQSMQSMQKAVERAHELANPPKTMTLAGPAIAPAKPASPAVAPALPAGAQPSPGVVVSAPAMQRMADAKAIQDALTRADAYVQEIRAKANAPQNDVANAEKAALDAAARHIRTAQQISLDLALAPLNMLRDSLLDLLAHPERIFDPTAQIEADIQRITAEIPALLDRIAGEVTQEAMGNLERAKNNLQQLQDSAAAASSVVDAMQKVSSSRLQSDLDALERFVPRPPPGATAVGTRAIAFPAGITVNRQAITAAFARTEPGRLPIVIQHRAAITDLASRWQNIKGRIKAPVQIEAASVQKVDHDLGQMFAGKQKADIDKKKLELTEEAKRRFAKDPKTLDKVLKYIESHAKG